MSLFKKSYLKKLRADLAKEKGRDIPDEAWDEIVKKVEAPIREELKENLPRAVMFSIFKTAEENDDMIIEIDGINIGNKIRQLRGIYEWLQQKKQYFGW